jgi:hypothetical protein
VRRELNALDATARVIMVDDGSCMTSTGAARAFNHVGISWKPAPGSRTLTKQRYVHGKFGRGRYTAFSMGEYATWDTVAVDGDEKTRVNLNSPVRI